jgi:hypothetical protein
MKRIICIAIVPLLLVLMHSLPAYGLGVLETGVAVGIVAEGTVQAGQQMGSTYEWLMNTKHLTREQIEQTQKAIDYLRQKGFKSEADQAQKMLNNSKSAFWKRFGSSFVYKEPATLKDGTKDRTVAETHGGPVNAVLNTGYIKLQGFFGATTDEGIPIKTDEDRARFQAKTLLHELEHLNTQANTHRVRIFDGARDFERDPMIKHLGNLRELGYTQEEIEKLKETYSNNPGYRRYVKHIEKELQTKDENPKPEKSDAEGGDGRDRGGDRDVRSGDRDSSDSRDRRDGYDRSGGRDRRDRDLEDREGQGRSPYDRDRFDRPRTDRRDLDPDRRERLDRERPLRPGADRDVRVPFDKERPQRDNSGHVRRPQSPPVRSGEAGHHGVTVKPVKPVPPKSSEPTSAEISNAYNEGCSLRKQLVSGSMSTAQVKELTRAKYGQFKHQKLKDAFKRGYNACGG